MDGSTTYTAYGLAITLGAATLSSLAWYKSDHLRSMLQWTSRKRQPPIKGLPDPDPLLDFDLANANTRNFLYANKTVRFPYFQTMAHQPMDINNWIEIDSDFDWYLSEKERIIAEQGDGVIQSYPENDEAAGELLELLVDYLPKRYPTLFISLPDGIHNLVTDVKVMNVSRQRGVDALISCSKLVQDDFLMAREREDGRVYFVGGLVAMPGFYLMSEKIGMSIETAHKPVPYFEEKLLKSVERHLKRFPPHEPFERTSWEIVDDRNLFRHLKLDQPCDPRIAPEDLWLRLDTQTLRKLPRTNAIVFGVHPVMARLGDFADAPLLPALLEKVHREADPVLMSYKLAHKYSDRVLPYLAELTKSQIERGLITGMESVGDFRLLVETPPNFSRTSLRNPTMSERAIAALEKNIHPGVPADGRVMIAATA